MSECRSDTCGPCHSGKHERCYGPCLCHDRGHHIETLTPSEKALAKMLDAWKQWPGVAFPRTPMCDALVGVTLLLEAHGLTIGDDTTEAGDVLLARAKKAGVL